MIARRLDERGVEAREPLKGRGRRLKSKAQSEQQASAGMLDMLAELKKATKSC